MSTETLIGFSGLKRRMLSCVSDGNASASDGKAGWSAGVSVQEEAGGHAPGTFHRLQISSNYDENQEQLQFPIKY